MLLFWHLNAKSFYPIYYKSDYSVKSVLTKHFTLLFSCLFPESFYIHYWLLLVKLFPEFKHLIYLHFSIEFLIWISNLFKLNFEIQGNNFNYILRLNQPNICYTSMSVHTTPNFLFHKNRTENYSNKEIKRIIVVILA